MDQHTAKTKARLLTKSLPTRRRRLHESSKSEEAGTAGAKRERERLTARLAKDIRDVEATIGQTTSLARDFDRAGHIIKFDPHAEPTGPVSRLAALAARMGCDVTLGQLCKDVAERAETAADVAQTRMDVADNDLQATAQLAHYLAVLADNKFDQKRAKVRQAHSVYMHYRRIST